MYFGRNAVVGGFARGTVRSTLVAHVIRIDIIWVEVGGFSAAARHYTLTQVALALLHVTLIRDETVWVHGRQHFRHLPAADAVIERV